MNRPARGWARLPFPHGDVKRWTPLTAEIDGGDAADALLTARRVRFPIFIFSELAVHHSPGAIAGRILSGGPE